MRIVIDMRALQTPHRQRGIGRYALDLLKSLVESDGGHDYGLLFHNGLERPTAFDRLPANFLPLPVEGPLLNEARQSWVMSIPRLRSREPGRRLNDVVMRNRHRAGLERAVRGFSPDVLHLTSPIDRFTDSLGNFGCRTVKTFFDAIPRIEPSLYYDLLSPLQKAHYDRQMDGFAVADAIVAISKSSRDEAIRYAGTDPSRTFAVHLAVSDEFSESTEIPIVGSPYFLFISALDPHKNAEGTVRAFAQAGLPKHRLVIVSTETSALFKQTTDLIEELGVDATITGFVPDDELRALVRGATALVSPSFYEGFGLPAAQAMLAGLPVIASNRTSQPEVVGDAGILVDPHDLAALSGAMRRIALDPDLRESLSHRGRERAARFSYARLAKNMRDIYEGRAPSDPVPGT